MSFISLFPLKLSQFTVKLLLPIWSLTDKNKQKLINGDRLIRPIQKTKKLWSTRRVMANSALTFQQFANDFHSSAQRGLHVFPIGWKPLWCQSVSCLSSNVSVTTFSEWPFLCFHQKGTYSPFFFSLNKNTIHLSNHCQNSPQSFPIVYLILCKHHS